MKHLLNLLFFALLLVPMQSCGILDFEVGTEVDIDDEDGGTGGEAFVLNLPADEFYVMVGDTFQLSALTNGGRPYGGSVFWTTEHDSVVSVLDGIFYANGEGETTVMALSTYPVVRTQALIIALPRWSSPGRQPYETIVVADLDVAGRPYDPETMRVAAYFNDVCAAVAEPLRVGTRWLARFRVASEALPAATQDITFRIHLFHDFQYGIMTETVPFDGETHGTPSRPIVLSIGEEDL